MSKSKGIPFQGLLPEQLAGHFVDVTEDDMVLIAFHKGKAYSCTGEGATWSDVSKVAANLQLYVADRESASLLEPIPGSLF